MDWVWAAKHMAYFRIPPEFKQPLVNHLRQEADLVVEPTGYQTALTKGSHPLLMGLFVSALEAIGCPAVRVLIYGIKHPLNLFPLEPASQHPLSRYNTFDLGRSVAGRDCLMLKRAPNTQQRHVKEQPMFLEAGQGFGTVTCTVQYNHHSIPMKLYPRVVHSIKSVRSKHIATDPNTMAAAKNRFKTMNKMFGHLEDATLKGGCRVEATVTAPTLQEACQLIASTPLLNLQAYLHNEEDEQMANYQLASYHLAPELAMEHARHILARAALSNLLRGDNNKKATRQVVVLLRDCLNAMGWNARKSNATHWEDPAAWWRVVPLPAQGVVLRPGQPLRLGAEPPSAQAAAPPVVVGHSVQHLDTVSELKAFWAVIKDQHICPQCHRQLTSNLDGGQKQFRLKCKACNHRASKSELRNHWDDMIQLGQMELDWEQHPEILPLSSHHSPPEEEEEEEEEEQEAPVLPSPNLHSRPRRGLVAMRAVSSSHHSSSFESPERDSVSQTEAEDHLPLLPASLAFAEQPPPSVSLGGQLMATKGFIPGDGNCQFTAISHHRYNNLRSGPTVRRKAVQWLKNHPDLVVEFTTTSQGHMGARPYLQRMAEPREWGDELTLLASSNACQLPLAVASRVADNHLSWSYYPDPYQEVYHGLYHVNNHYEILYVSK